MDINSFTTNCSNRLSIQNSSNAENNGLNIVSFSQWPSMYDTSMLTNETSRNTSTSYTVSDSIEVNSSEVCSRPVSLEQLTPKKKFRDSFAVRLREKLKSPGVSFKQHSGPLHLTEPVNVVKDRYLISLQQISHSINRLKKQTSFRQLADITSKNFKCTDLVTEEQFRCKVINEPLRKVQIAYLQIQRDSELSRSFIYGHQLIRDVHDLVPESTYRTYIILTKKNQKDKSEDLHTYIRNKRRLSETEARLLFHQICQTVLLCHRNGVILRDLKLKRFYFIDEEKTKLQYESLEGSMILNDITNDSLCDKIGCPLYTAPELLCSNQTYKGKPADMWSLGVILYTMLLGQYPFYENGNYNLITIIRHCKVQLPSSLSRTLRWLLETLLHKNYAERPTAEEIFFSSWLKEIKHSYMNVPLDFDYKHRFQNYTVDAHRPGCEDVNEERI
ncbi:tribbles [Teleopsis dalmanni]|uniref:tribbles n=1 Tax=Teleopsis dalmanni TaxID=139649 RepID=UPI0018CF2BAE|nr:tribbles [Teleopsis dalmanni]